MQPKNNRSTWRVRFSCFFGHIATEKFNAAKFRTVGELLRNHGQLNSGLTLFVLAKPLPRLALPGLPGRIPSWMESKYSASKAENERIPFTPRSRVTNPLGRSTLRRSTLRRSTLRRSTLRRSIGKLATQSKRHLVHVGDKTDFDSFSLSIFSRSIFCYLKKLRSSLTKPHIKFNGVKPWLREPLCEVRRQTADHH